ncbi:MAG TPA: NAD(P)/FAD-dependent oxidoreductase [Mycobacterium sp.]|nr:NAD(P)/FAD-dependent oxidoreductase [Mycobacterium sp.]
MTLDTLLVHAAGATGVEVRTGARVRRLLIDDGRVTGVQTDDGPIHARLVVGADGRHSTVASAVGAREYHVAPPGRMAVWGYFEGADRHGHFRFGRVGDMGFLASPTDSDLYMVAVAPDLEKQHDFHADRDAYFTAAIRKWPELADMVGGGQRVGPLRVVTKWHGYFRQSAGPGWVLVGDAGHFKDFAPGQGISDAFRQAEQLARDIEAALGTTNLDTAMQRWWRWRDNDAYEMYWFASRVGQPGISSPLTTRLLRGISADAAATRSFLRVVNHDLLPSQLFTPAMAARATARAIRDEPSHTLAILKEAFATGKQNIRQARQKRVRPPGISDTGWQLL